MILVVAAHPDDEVLGCGGAIARATAAGTEVQPVFMADGVLARAANGLESSDCDRLARQAMANRAAAILGARAPVFFNYADNRMDTVARIELARSLESLSCFRDVSEIWTHHPGDLNVDHRRVTEAVMIAFRPQPSVRVRRILAFEVLSSTGWGGSGFMNFAPDHFVNVEAYLDAKMEAIAAYESEMRPFPHARSSETALHLSRLRGSLVGCAAAEAFVTLRSVEW